MSVLNFLNNSAWADTAATATTAAAGTPPQPSIFAMVMPFALMFIVFYFLLIRPQQKKMKQQEELIGGLQKGDEIIMQSGIFGKVTGIADKVLTVEVADNVKVKVLKGQVATVLKGDQKALQ
jgi:preprotein translocase subunit YajC